jgi:hypothetical protein
MLFGVPKRATRPFMMSFLLGGLGANEAFARPATTVSDQITHIRKQVLDLEQELVDGLHSAKQAKTNMKKIQTLLKLQKEERTLGEKRLAELESTVEENSVRRFAGP